MIDDGYIKYDRSYYTKSEPLKHSEYKEIEFWREKLYVANLIGEYEEEAIGYGNISCRCDYQDIFKSDHPQFCISGTQTGKYPKLTGEHYTRVLDINIDKQIVRSQGPLEASSESLTHAAIYQCNGDIQFVFHIHSRPIWEGMIKDNLDSTPADIPYGTAEMANAVRKVINHKESGHLVMKGHEEGVIIYGTTSDQTGELTLKLHDRYC